MKHLFIPYELALQLKEKGFDEPCLGFYELGAPNDFYQYLYDEELTNSRIDKEFDEDYDCTAPLYQQIIDWFFNKHKMSIEAPMDILQSEEYDGCYCFIPIIKEADQYKERVVFEGEPLPTKQKAWIKAIEEALKLIP